MPWEMPREAPTFYFNSALLRKAAAQIYAEWPDLVAGTKFEQVGDILQDYLKEGLWPREYKVIRNSRKTLLDCYESEVEQTRITNDIKKYFLDKFDFKLFMMPIICREHDRHTILPPIHPSNCQPKAWIGGDTDLLKFLGNRFSVNTEFDLNNFPPEPQGERVFKENISKTTPPTWLVTLARHEEIAILNLWTLFGAMVLAIGPDRAPNHSDTRFGGLAYASADSYGFGATRKVKFPVVYGNATIKPEYLDQPYHVLANEEAWETNFTLDLVDIIANFGANEQEKRIKTACYFVGMAYLADPISRFLLQASAIDALFGFGDRKLGTTAKKGIEQYCSKEPSAKKKLELFLKIRGSLAHGKRSYPEESSSYFKFLKKFDEEPLVTIWRITRSAIVEAALDLDGYNNFLEKTYNDTRAISEEGGCEEEASGLRKELQDTINLLKQDIENIEVKLK